MSNPTGERSLDPRVVLKAHGLWSKKHFGQNFLVAPEIPTRIAEAGGARPSDTIFEIGAGVGTLTHALARRGGRVVALEYDRELLPVLRAELAYAPNVEIRQGNVLDVDWAALAEELGPLVVYGNIPYHLSSPILDGLLKTPSAWTRACFLVQREFAERVSAPPGSGKRCGAISAHAALLTHATQMFNVEGGAFHPPPKVTSAVLLLERRATPAEDVGDLKTFKKLVKALFQQRRKMARKALKPVVTSPEALLAQAGIEPTRRGEELSLRELAALSRAALS
ncbi:ribosomal RNA small subunit methyltransferase A [Myxococcota bacterium]|nr:ribosomal RNA small subunit methyltransferase A [Myxococcota bacterium]MBU1432350.1 ribosomal RNA small subunit methyltransferase A [Myxococcota bacterium]MBU1896379.1 ribosomal RNA small subunit methyltransferase A [Myxococcota bacterium]